MCFTRMMANSSRKQEHITPSVGTNVVIAPQCFYSGFGTNPKRASNGLLAQHPVLIDYVLDRKASTNLAQVFDPVHRRGSIYGMMIVQNCAPQGRTRITERLEQRVKLERTVHTRRDRDQCTRLIVNSEPIKFDAFTLILSFGKKEFVLFATYAKVSMVPKAYPLVFTSGQSAAMEMLCDVMTTKSVPQAGNSEVDSDELKPDSDSRFASPPYCVGLLLLNPKVDEVNTFLTSNLTQRIEEEVKTTFDDLNGTVARKLDQVAEGKRPNFCTTGRKRLAQKRPPSLPLIPDALPDTRLPNDLMVSRAGVMPLQTNNNSVLGTLIEGGAALKFHTESDETDTIHNRTTIRFFMRIRGRYRHKGTRPENGLLQRRPCGSEQPAARLRTAKRISETSLMAHGLIETEVDTCDTSERESSVDCLAWSR
jgi:hypothetical protein